MKVAKVWIILDHWDNSYRDDGTWSTMHEHAKHYETFELAWKDAIELRKHFGQCYVSHYYKYS